MHPVDIQSDTTYLHAIFIYAWLPIYLHVSGPTRVSYEDLLSEMSAAAGTTVKINTVSEEKFTEILKSIGLPEPLASSLTCT